ncbi:CAP domain-containing protein [Streptomyces sp. NPDC048551]|uniref:CAP domain-containing protein n=1 Tax=Streptomyces sp. NPDC048551 TaxID=3155758 RepID=UPI003414343E
MRKHRKKTHYRKIAVAAGALAVVGVPTAAMACLGPQDSGHVRPAASRQDGRPWQDAPLGGAGSRQPVEAPVQADAPEAAPVEPAQPAQPVAQPVAQPADEAPAEPAAETPPPARPAQPEPAQPQPAGPEPAQPSAQPSAPAGSETLSGPQAEVLALVNKERAAVGCPVLTVNAKLTKAAQDHSADMAAHNNMSHTGSDGSDPGARITRAGYEWRTYGENVAYGYASAAQVMEGWMNSPGHKRNILDCSYKEIGIGLAQPGQYWTQDFGATR